MLGRHAGADDVDAIEARLFLDLVSPPLEREMTIADIDGEVLGHFPFVDNGTDRNADLGGTLGTGVPAVDLLLDAGELPFGRNQQLLALARALDGKIAVAADDQPFSREHVGGADFG